MPRRFLLILALGFVTAASGCSIPPIPAGLPYGQATAQNPLFVAANNPEGVWERTVDVLHDYQFEMARENKLDGVIETRYKTGAGLLEPWQHDSVGLENRVESSLQSIRRRVFVHVTPADGGFLISVEAFKELEDLIGLAANSPGGATFTENAPLQRDLDLVVGQSAPSGWIPQGRDPVLEQAILQSLQANFSH